MIPASFFVEAPRCSVGSQIRTADSVRGRSRDDAILAAKRRFVLFVHESAFAGDWGRGAYATTITTFATTLTRACANPQSCSGTDLLYAGTISVPRGEMLFGEEHDELMEALDITVRSERRMIPIVVSSSTEHILPVLRACKRSGKPLNMIAIERSLPAFWPHELTEQTAPVDALSKAGWLGTAVATDLIRRAALIGVDDLAIGAGWDRLQTQIKIRVRNTWRHRSSDVTAHLHGYDTGMAINMDALEPLGPSARRAESRLPLSELFEIVPMLCESLIRPRFLHIVTGKAATDDPTSTGEAIARIVLHFIQQVSLSSAR